MSDLRQRIEALSPRQFQILVFVAHHFSSREIGEKLGLSPATVDSHIAAALQRLGLANRREAALKMIELGFSPALAELQPLPVSSTSHHGGDPPSNHRQLAPIAATAISEPPGRGLARPSRGNGDEPPAIAHRPGMGRVILRCLFDAFYIILFFAVMSAGAFGVHRIMVECERSAIDPFVLLILKWVSYALAVLDGVGVVVATGLLTYRFIRAILSVDD
jgi:DNA-binding CsgD family transcriptional regulator/TM2 domain-containing membrane protein YozV